MAPIQGYTDYIWRNAHQKFFGGIDMYYSPFLRIERNSFRERDIIDISLTNNKITNFTPQILACEPIKMVQMVEKIIELGYYSIDINLGCPFPMIAKKNCGCGMMSDVNLIQDMVNSLVGFSGIEFSIKMRLGYTSNTDWKNILHIISKLAPRHITMHPRIGLQQYKGDIDMESFNEFYNTCQLPLVFNGEIKTTDDIDSILSKYPNLEGIMIGRGLLMNPVLLSQNKIETRLFKQFHDELFAAYSQKLEGGDSQILMKMKTFWEYFLPEADKKSRKLIKKSSSLAKYQAATNSLWNNF